MPDTRIQRVLAVIATWCPHCAPLSVENSKILAERLGASCRILDIDRTEDLRYADELVEKYGDNSEDYLVPQIFLQYESGETRHVLTGFSESPEATKKHWEDLLKSQLVERLTKDSPN
jgi:hypothetical protein